MRLTLLHILQAATVIPSTAAAESARHHETCKAFPGTSSWPRDHQWNKLNETLQGRLIKPVAPGGVCHPDQPNYDEGACPAMREQWTTYDWHAADPVSVMWENWSNWTCDPEPDMPCSTAGYPSFVINATTAEHVKAGVDFARKHNVRLLVKSSGHDFLGRSNAPGSLSIWVHHMNDMKYHKGNFKLTGSDTTIEGDAISCGGGTSMYDLYKATDIHGTTVVGGMSKSVSVGGYITGGGHSLLSPDYGLAADNVLEIEVVTPSGDIIVVNEDQYPDLFWALCGGGGSTFGVITSFTLKAHPTPKVHNFLFFAVTTPDMPLVGKFVAFMASKAPDMLESGLRGYTWISFNMTNEDPAPGEPPTWAGMAGSLSLFDQDPKKVESIVSRLNETVAERFNGMASVAASPVESYGSFLEFFDKNFDQGSAGPGSLLVSRLIHRDALEGDPEALEEALRAASGSAGPAGFYLLGGRGVRDAEPRGGSNSVNPGWRRAYIHSLASLGIPPFNKTAELEAEKTLNKAFDPLRKLTPGMGAYLNEAAGFEKHMEETFWGDNYHRLLAIKRRVDPGNVLWCAPCVGHEGWEARDDGRVCRKQRGPYWV